MKTTFYTPILSYQTVFKIDLIVWKHSTNPPYALKISLFKIDLIVWKHGYKQAIAGNDPGLK